MRRLPVHHQAVRLTQLFIMRLLSTQKLDLVDFGDYSIPDYAILSHRWSNDEATFKDFDRNVQQKRKGFEKIERCCEQAQRDGILWAWIDTCCIDKSSSAELSEAINSMWTWYKNCHSCYIYLGDVTWNMANDKTVKRSLDAFEQSNWFTRGWTLQELLAPASGADRRGHVYFFDRSWNVIAKDGAWTGSAAAIVHRGVMDVVSSITRIQQQYLPWNKMTGRWQSVERVSVAKKMSWASRRHCSRVEDHAYCLMGLFGVNMPLLYGEGVKAFRRLQLEIIKETDDESIFAWVNKSCGLTDMLAPWPDAFSESGDIVTGDPVLRFTTISGPYTMTNKGLEVPCSSSQFRTRDGCDGEMRALLACGKVHPPGPVQVEIVILLLAGIWVRWNETELIFRTHQAWIDSSAHVDKKGEKILILHRNSPMFLRFDFVFNLRNTPI